MSPSASLSTFTPSYFLNGLRRRVTNRAIRTTAAFDKDSERIRTCTDLSSTLSKISSSANAAVTPALAAAIASHGKNNERMEADFKRLGHIWEDIFQHFMNEIVHAIDSEVVLTLDRFRHELSAQMTSFTPLLHSPSPTNVRRINEGDLIVRKRKMDGAGAMLADRDGDMVNRNNGSPGTTHLPSRGEEQGSKRRRLAGDNSIASPIDAGNADVLAMVKEMTAKLRQQEAALAKLREENDWVSSNCL